jgi:hypothetical protein
MDDEQVGTVIDEIERAMVIDDPAFVRRFRSLSRSEAIYAVIVFVLLAFGAVFLTVTLASAHPVPGVIALAALVGAVVTDAIHERARRR